MSFLKKRYRKIIAICVVCIFFALVLSFSIFYLINITPQFKGSYSIGNFENEILEFGSYNYEKYDDIDNYWDAYSVAKDAISKRFPEGIFSEVRFDFYDLSVNRCDVYYDAQSNTWQVYAYPQSLSKRVMIFGGAYRCIISSDGTVIACWGEP